MTLRDAGIVGEVLDTLAGKVLDGPGLPDRVELRQASPGEWLYRVYAPNSGDYEGGIITVDMGTSL